MCNRSTSCFNRRKKYRSSGRRPERFGCIRWERIFPVKPPMWTAQNRGNPDRIESVTSHRHGGVAWLLQQPASAPPPGRDQRRTVFDERHGRNPLTRPGLTLRPSVVVLLRWRVTGPSSGASAALLSHSCLNGILTVFCLSALPLFPFPLCTCAGASFDIRPTVVTPRQTLLASHGDGWGHVGGRASAVNENAGDDPSSGAFSVQSISFQDVRQK